MASEDRILKILLQLKADVADTTKVTGALKEVEAQATRTAAAVKASAASGIDPAVAKSEAEFAARIAARRLADEQAILAAQVAAQSVLTQNNALSEQGLETAERASSDMGGRLFIAAAIAYKIYEAIAHSADEAVRLAKETERQSDDLLKQVQHWQDIAAAAGDFHDIVKLGDDIGPRLEAMAEKLDEFRRREIDKTQKAYDFVTKMFMGVATGGQLGGFGSTGFNQGNLDESTKAQERYNQIQLKSANESIDRAQKAKEVWEAVNLLPLNQAVEEYSRKLDDLKAKQAGIDRNKDVPSFEEWKKLNKEIELTEKRVDQLTKTQSRLASETEKVSAGIAKVDFAQLDKGDQLAALNVNLEEIQVKLREVGVEAASPNEALEKAKDLTKENAEEVIKLVEAWAKVLGQIAQVVQQQEADRAKEEAEGRRAAQERVNASLRESGLLLSDIRQQQQLIANDPFLSTEAKQIQLANLYRKEQETILLEILKIKALIAQIEAVGGPKEQQQVAQLTAKLHGLGFEYQQLGQKVKSLSFSGELQADLTAWANSFGTAAHQIAGVITGTLNVAIAQTAQLLTDAIFRTGDWKQALLQVGEAGVKMIIQMLLQWVISRTLMSVLNAAFGKVDASAANKLAESSAAAWSPAAVSASIATEGVAAGTGTAAYIAALVAGLSAATGIAGGGGGFRKGGYTGDGSADEYAGPAHKKEFVFDAGATSSHGIEDLELLRRGQASIIPHFAGGGDVDLPPIGGGDFGAPPLWENWQDTGGIFNWWNQNRSNYDPNASWYNGSRLIDPGSSPAGSNPFNNWVQGWLALHGGVTNPNIGNPNSWYPSNPFNVTGFGTHAPSGVYGLGAGPTAVPTYWGHSGGIGNAGGLGASGGGPPASKRAGHSANYWVFQDGGLVDGPPSSVDNVLAMLATGEHVIQTPAVAWAERNFGPNFLKDINEMRIPMRATHFAGGGLVGSSSPVNSSAGGSGSGQVLLKVIPVTDWKAALREARKDDDHRVFIVDTVKGAAHEIGIGAVNG